MNTRLRNIPGFAAAAIASLLLAGLASTARAQSRQGHFQVEPLVGYSAFGQVEAGIDEGTPYSLDLRDEPSVGVRVGYGVSDTFQVELEYSRTETGLILDGPFGFPPSAFADFTLDSVLANATLHLTRSRVVPYVTIGAGVAHIDSATLPGPCPPEFACLLTVPIPRPHSETRPAASAGVGVKAAISEAFGLRLDARGYALNQGDTRFYHEVEPGDREEWLTSAVVSAGLLFSF